MEVRVYVKGTKEDYDRLFVQANVRFGEYSNGKWVIDIRIPECNTKENPFRYQRITTIIGLIRKLSKNGHLIKQQRSIHGKKSK